MYDFIILGGGPAGYVAAERAAARGLSTLLIEEKALGGTCLNVGCIPTKSLLAGAKVYKHAAEGAKFGVKAESLSYDFAAAQAWKDKTVETLRNGVAFSLKKAGAEIREGRAKLESAHSIVLADGTKLEAKDILIATGSSPALPPIPGLAGNPKVVDSTGLLAVKEPPRRLAIVGGGVIGIEFASYFSAIGCEVTVVEMLPEILPFMDSELVAIFKRSLRGLKIETGSAVESIDGGTLHYSKGGEKKSVEADLILVATGRRPNIADIGLEAAGVEFTKRGITVDDELRTNTEGIWAAGDVTGRAQLAHTASAMGEAVVDGILGKPRAISWNSLPWVVYGDPECSGCGLTEGAAAKAGIAIKKAVLPARANGRFLAENGVTGQGAVKLIAAEADGRLLGATIVAPYAGEMIWGMQDLIARGATAAELKTAIFPHPTVSELIREAGLAL